MSVRFADLNTGVIFDNFQSKGREPCESDKFITRKSGEVMEEAVETQNCW